jgi:hypothetical protein
MKFFAVLALLGAASAAVLSTSGEMDGTHPLKMRQLPDW